MIKLSIGGVPEHFNLPWRRLLDSGQLAASGVDASWQDYPGGTGAMVSALEDRVLDVAVLLTEGAVAGIGKGADFRVVSLYTRSPLMWGIHVPAGSPWQVVDELRGARFAVSRLGSGSHLMAYALARSRGWASDEVAIEIVGSLSGAIEAFAEGRADVFLWEKSMTQPVVDAGQFRCVGDFVAPWPAFVVCASSEALRTKRSAISPLLEAVFPAAQAFRKDSGAPAEIAARYGLTHAAADRWLSATEWPETPGIDPAMLDEVAAAIAALGLIPDPAQRAFTARIERPLPGD